MSIDTPEELEQRIKNLKVLNRVNNQSHAIGGKNIMRKFTNTKCGYSGCREAGTLTSSIRGSETWYCPEHFRQQ